MSQGLAQGLPCKEVFGPSLEPLLRLARIILTDKTSLRVAHLGLNSEGCLRESFHRFFSSLLAKLVEKQLYYFVESQRHVAVGIETWQVETVGLLSLRLLGSRFKHAVGLCCIQSRTSMQKPFFTLDGVSIRQTVQPTFYLCNTCIGCKYQTVYQLDIPPGPFSLRSSHCFVISSSGEHIFKGNYQFMELIVVPSVHGNSKSFIRNLFCLCCLSLCIILKRGKVCLTEKPLKTCLSHWKLG